MTTIMVVPRCSTAYSRLPMAMGSGVLPASRTTNRSPKVLSKSNSGATRLSEQASTATFGDCVFASFVRSATRSRLFGLPSMKRAFPAERSSQSGSLAGAFCWAKAARPKQRTTSRCFRIVGQHHTGKAGGEQGGKCRSLARDDLRDGRGGARLKACPDTTYALGSDTSSLFQCPQRPQPARNFSRSSGVILSQRSAMRRFHVHGGGPGRRKPPNKILLKMSKPRACQKVMV